MQMLRDSLASIDWRQPWLEPWRDIGQLVAARVEAGLDLHQALNVASCAPVRFVEHASLPRSQPYESFVHATGNCPTRAGLHDFFNGLCWIRFPQTKRRLNHLQAQAIALAAPGAARGAVRDRLTVFDENAALLDAPQPLWDALAAKDWRRLCCDLRPLWAQARLVLFGHALLEKLVHPRKAITAHVYRTDAGSHELADLDAWVACSLSAAMLACKPFVHLPILGVPGWWPANEACGFYDDTDVFRQPRTTVAGAPGAAPGNGPGH